MVAVEDIIRESEDQPVRISGQEDRDPCTAFTECLYEGALYDVPEELKGLEVLETGWSLIKKMNVITVYIGKEEN